MVCGYVGVQVLAIEYYSTAKRGVATAPQPAKEKRGKVTVRYYRKSSLSLTLNFSSQNRNQRIRFRSVVAIEQPTSKCF